MSQKYEKLKAKLQELFQLDKPELDFGLYRIMHAKAAEVSQFLDRDLLPQVKEAFAVYKTADKAEIEQELAKVVAQAEGLGVDPETTQKVKELRARLAGDAVDIGALESEVYDHLFRFFRRYYSDGDFLSQRVYKPGVYAIPYEGEEVTLHWANKDQYYIKTSEYLRDYAFRLRAADEARPMRVHFRLVDAAEGEHGNVKDTQGKERVFILTADGESGRDFIAEEDGPEGKELVLRFEYRPATMNDWPREQREEEQERLKNPKPPKQKDLDALAFERVLGVSDPELAPWMAELGKPHITASGEAADYTRLEAHLRRYNARNTFDYFIHKDLGGFLRSELDFYIKNEVMHLDDIESESVPRVEQYLSKIKVIRAVAGKIIDFLAQLENFQKTLWLKKKFVVETSWCVRVGCIPESFYPEIAANEAQVQEWVALHAIDELQGDQGDLTMPRYTEPPTPEFVAANSTLMVDSRHFSADFTARLLDALGDVDEQTDGVLFQSENFQTLSLMQARYREQVKCVYIDPPYNTGQDEFVYKDNYQESSWATLVDGRVNASVALMSSDGAFTSSLDDKESPILRAILAQHPSLVRLGEFVWKTRNTDNRIITRFSQDHESIHVWAKDAVAGRVIDRSHFSNPDDDPRGSYVTDPLTGKAKQEDRPNLHYTIVNPDTGDEYPPDPDFGWITDRDGFEVLLRDNRVHWPANPVTGKPRKKRFRSEMGERAPVSSFGIRIKQGEGNQALVDLFSAKKLSFPKPPSVLERICDWVCGDRGWILDYFAGSGTTGHAVINLNREDGGQRKFILVEMGDYFDTVLLPRLKKVTYTPEWKDGKPKRLATPEEAERSPRIMKVLRLESYEDTLNNLEPQRTEAQQELLDLSAAQGTDGLKEQYILRYMLEVETRGSQSLLNVEAFADPTAYGLKVKRPGSDESRYVNVDLIETFNWLIGLTVRHLAAPRAFSAEAERDDEGRLRLKGRLQEDADGPYWFRTVTGTLPDGRRTLVIWRKLSGDPEQDNLVLDEWFTKQGYSSKDSEFDLIYVNGGNNLENLRTPEDTWKVRLIEEDFHRLMFEGERG